MSASFVEVERKFLVWPVPHEKLEQFARRSFKQGYVVTGETEVRVRSRIGVSDHHLAVKRGLGYVRDEVEVEINENEAEKLFEMCGDRVLTKTRYDLPNGFVLDELHGKLEGLWILEHEHALDEDMPVIPKFITVMMEVTDKPAFKTNQLAERLSA